MRTAQAGTIRFLRLLMVASIALPLGLFAYTSWVNYRAAYHLADQRVERSLTIAEENASNLFRSSDLILAAANELVANRSDDEIRANEKAYHDVLRRLAAGLKGVNSVWVFGADGVPVVTSALYPAPRTFSNVDRDYFQAQVDRDVGAYIGAVVAPKVPGQEIYTVSRRRPGDRFMGVSAVAIKAADTQAFYQAVGSAPGSYFALVRADGSFLARYPAPVAIGLKLTDASTTMKSIAANPQAGINTLTSQTDAVRRRLGYRKVPDFPAYVFAAVDEDAIVSEWMRLMGSYLVVGAPATALLFAALLFGLVRTQRLHREAEARANAEAALRQSQKMEAIGQLTGGVAHDFNNLLTIVLGNLGTAKRVLDASHPAAPRLQRAVASALQGAERAAAVTERLLAFSRRQPLKPIVVDVNSALRDSEVLLRRALGENRALKVVLASGARNIEVDPSQLDVAVLNLVVNARDAIGEHGSVRLTTGTLDVDDTNSAAYADLAHGRYTFIEVADDGVGMPPDVLARAIEPFFTTKSTGRGTGLGLSQVYGFVKQSGGHVTIDSAVGQGTTVRMYFPSVDRAADPVQTGEQRDCPIGNGERVLVVEDDEQVRHYINDTLRDLRYEVTEAENGEQALRALDGLNGNHAGIDLVLTDIVMPGMRGIELARRIQAAHPDMPVIFMTGYLGDAMRTAEVEPGVDLLKKPFSREEIARRIHKALTDKNLAG
jgi:two-component system, NtrC family, sensor kinase